MANKKGVIMYYDLIEQLSDFNDKDFREIIVAMMEYDKTGKEPQFDGMKKVAFKFIKTTIDKNNEEYTKKCENLKQNAIKRWNTNNANGCNCIQMDANDTDIDKDIDKDIKKENIIINNNTKEKDSVNASHTQKHKHGEYKNVLLSDDELEKLNETYGADTTQRAITYLDEYIEMKGYKAKSHYLCIRKWVISALAEHKNNTKECLPDRLKRIFDEMEEE